MLESEWWQTGHWETEARELKSSFTPHSHLGQPRPESEGSVNDFQ
jgi:hypothetical protein